MANGIVIRQYSGESAKQMLENLGADTTYVEDGYQLQANIGDWVIKSDNGIKVYSNEEIQRALKYLDEQRMCNKLKEWVVENS